MLESHPGVIAHYSNKETETSFYLHKIKIYMLWNLQILSGRKNKTLLIVVILGNDITYWHRGQESRILLLIFIPFEVLNH